MRGVLEMGVSAVSTSYDSWIHNCFWLVDLKKSSNGLYLKGKHKSVGDGVNWYHWKGHYYSMKETTMMVRRE
jgi:hypothetical protein